MRITDLVRIVRRGPLGLFLDECSECGRLIDPWADAELCPECSERQTNPHHRDMAVALIERPLDPTTTTRKEPT